MFSQGSTVWKLKRSEIVLHRGGIVIWTWNGNEIVLNVRLQEGQRFYDSWRDWGIIKKDLDKAEYRARESMPSRLMFVRFARAAVPLVPPHDKTPHDSGGIWEINVDPLKKIILLPCWNFSVGSLQVCN